MPVTVQNDSFNPRKVYYNVNGITKFVFLKGQEVFTIDEIDDPLALLNRVSVLKYQIEQKTSNSHSPKQAIFDVNGNYVRVSASSSSYVPPVYRSYIYVNDNSDIDFDGSESFSISFWFKHNGNSIIASPIRKLFNIGLGPDFGYLLSINTSTISNSTAQFSTNAGVSVSNSSTPAIDLTADNWNLVVGVFDTSGRATLQSVEMNGNKSNNTAAQTNINNSGAPLYIQGSSNNLGMDEVTIWDKPLSDAETAELYNSGAGIPITSHSASGSVISHYSMAGVDAFINDGIYLDSIGNYNALTSGITVNNLSEDGVGTIDL